MLRSGYLSVVIVMMLQTVAGAHGVDTGHVHEEAAFPLAEVLAGLAFILSVGSFWMSLRTRRLMGRDPH